MSKGMGRGQPSVVYLRESDMHPSRPQFLSSYPSPLPQEGVCSPPLAPTSKVLSLESCCLTFCKLPFLPGPRFPSL